MHLPQKISHFLLGDSVCFAHPILSKEPGCAPCMLCSLFTVGEREERESHMETCKCIDTDIKTQTETTIDNFGDYRI